MPLDRKGLSSHWAKDHMDGYGQQSAANKSKYVKRIKAWIIAHTNIMDDLRDEEHIAEDDHPLVIAEEVNESQIEKQAEIYISTLIQNWI